MRSAALQSSAYAVRNRDETWQTLPRGILLLDNTLYRSRSPSVKLGEALRNRLETGLFADNRMCDPADA